MSAPSATAEVANSVDTGASASPAPQPRDYNCMNLLIDYLQAEGTRYVFGVPGGAIAEFMRVVNASEIQFVVSKHEGGAAFMADGYARVSGKLGACVSTTGPGATNMLTGVAVAHFDGVPLLCISGATSRSEVGKAALQETSGRGVDTAAIYQPVTHYSAILPSAEAMPTMLSSALRHCWSGARGAAYIGLPTDLSTAKVSAELAPSHPSQYRGVDVVIHDDAAARRAAELLAQARQPLLMVGSGARRVARDALVRLAERLGAAVATTLKAKGVFPEDHPLSLRNFGTAGSLWANEYLVNPQSDVIVVLGCSLNDWATGSWNRKLFKSRKVIQVDIEPRNICSWALVDQIVIGDMSAVIDALNRHLDQLDVSVDRAAHQQQVISEFKASRPHAANLEQQSSDSVPLKPQRVMQDLMTALPDDTVVFIDSGNTTAWYLHYGVIKGQQQFQCCARQLSMGWSFAASIGGKLAAPHKPVVAIGGDGALLMNGTELHTAVQMKLGVVWICFFDQQYGTVYHGNRAILGAGIYADLSPLDPVRFAQSMGARGVYVDKPGELCQVLPELLDAGYPSLVCVAIDPMEPPPFGARFSSLGKQMGKMGDFNR